MRWCCMLALAWGCADGGSPTDASRSDAFGVDGGADAFVEDAGPPDEACIDASEGTPCDVNAVEVLATKAATRRRAAMNLFMIDVVIDMKITVVKGCINEQSSIYEQTMIVLLARQRRQQQRRDWWLEKK